MEQMSKEEMLAKDVVNKKKDDETKLLEDKDEETKEAVDREGRAEPEEGQGRRRD